MMFRRLKAGLVLAITTALVPTMARAGQIDFFTVGASNPNAGYYAGTIGFSVSDTGVVAATSNLSHASETGAAYTTGGTTNLPVSGRLLSISADGTRAAGYSNDSAGGIAWTVGAGTTTSLATLPGYTQAAAISNNGQYVAGVGGSPMQMASWNFDGTAGTALGNLGGSSFGWAGAVSNTGLVGGTSGDGSRAAAIATAGSAGSAMQLGQGYLDASIPDPYGKVLGINSDGTILVGESLAKIGNIGNNIHMRAFIVNNLLSDDTLVALATPAGWESASARDVTDRLFSGSGIVVGNLWNGDKSSPTDQAAAIWVPGSGVDLLQNYAASLGITIPAGYTLLTAFGISTDGTYITGSARDASGNQVGYLLDFSGNQPVPEPASVLSLAVGGVAVLYSRRRRRVRIA
ncbi:PEP-CTERM sorting domain-containing protein [bacterium]|nr:PEP-CTERM sorting domain-containing protein [bacterium]